MSTAKFEKLIDLIINEDQERAEQLFHEIVVEKSREIYENLMAEEMPEDGMEEDAVSGLMDEITSEEEDAHMAMEDDMESEVEDDDVTVDAGDEEGMGDMEDMGDMGSAEPATKDDVMDLEDKLDQILAAFEAEFGEEEGEEDQGDQEEMDDAEEEGEEEGVMESVEMKKVQAPKHGDDGAQRVSPVAKNSGQAGMASKPVNFSGGAAESGGKAAAPKDMGMKFKNAPDGAKDVADGKGDSVKAKGGDDGANKRSVVPESKKLVKKMIK